MTFNKAQQEYIENRFPSYDGIIHITKEEFEKRLAQFKEISNEPDPELYKIIFIRPDALDATKYDLTLEEATVYLLDVLVNTKWRDVKTYVAGEYLEKHDGDKWKVVKQ